MLKTFKVIAPTLKTIKAFDAEAASLSEKQSILQYQSKSLSALRDTLLPKLLSGELRIPEAEQAVINQI